MLSIQNLRHPKENQSHIIEMFFVFVNIASCLASAVRLCFHGHTMHKGWVTVEVQLTGLFSASCGSALVLAAVENTKYFIAYDP